MRSFSLQGPYSMSMALAAKFALSLPSGRRSTSAPAAYSSHEESEAHDVREPPVKDPIRAPSPAPTEVLDPEPESILEQLQLLNIKVRDYAYPGPPPPYSPNSNTQTHYTPKPVTAIFDQYKGIAEFEYRLSQTPRTYPISGKTLRRLLDLKWVSMDEVKARIHQMDWEAMKEFDAKDPRYPWRPCRWTAVPDAQGRQRLLSEHGGTFVHLDRVRRMMELQIARDEQEQQLIREAQERLRILEAEREGGMGMVVSAEDDDDEDEEGVLDGEFVHIETLAAAGKKRALEDTSPASSLMIVDESPAGSKRVRLSGILSPSAASAPSSQSTSSTPLMPVPRVAPLKQYPAPLSSYNPEIYPEAAAVIEAAEARPLPPLPPRVDTPPLEDEDTQDTPEYPLHAKSQGLKRTLSRTQTFRQL